MVVKSNSVKGEARQLILNAAEELFAEQGVDAVSLRKINAAAGVSPGVLHYHFGSREAPVAELINRHMSGLVAEREVLLRALADSPQPSVVEIVAALLRPLAKLGLQGGEAGARYVRFITRLYTDRSPILAEVSQRYQHVNSLYPLLLQRALPTQSTKALELRLAMANHSMLQILSDLTANKQTWFQQGSEQLTNATVMQILEDFMTSGIVGSEPSRQFQ